jgi:hypothetical protein
MSALGPKPGHAPDKPVSRERANFGLGARQARAADAGPARAEGCRVTTTFSYDHPWMDDGIVKPRDLILIDKEGNICEPTESATP